MKKIFRFFRRLIKNILLAFAVFFIANTLIRIFVGEVLTKAGIENSFTELIIGSVVGDEIEEAKPLKSQIISRNDLNDEWQKAYPFKESPFIANFCTSKELKLPVEEKSLSKAERINDFAIKYIWGYKWLSTKFISAKFSEKPIKDLAVKYNEVNVLEDGFLVAYMPRSDMYEKALSVVALSEYCKKIGSEFLYIQEPYKIDKYNDTDISGVLDFSNQNQDSLIELLKANDVSVLDFRELIHNAGWSRKDVFYRTDHHWLAETGFWASNQLLKYLKDNYGYNVNAEIIDEANFDKKIYKDYFLGSQGKKIGRLKTIEPEDFTLYYPKFETKLKVYIPPLVENKTGDMTLLYNMNCISKIDYYNLNPYATYSYGDRPLMQISNELITDDDTKILLIHDSFCDCVIPFISLGIKNVHAIDMRHFTGSLEAYIDSEKPDIVIVSSVIPQGGAINWSTHKDSFDFR